MRAIDSSWREKSRGGKQINFEIPQKKLFPLFFRLGKNRVGFQIFPFLEMLHPLFLAGFGYVIRNTIKNNVHIKN